MLDDSRLEFPERAMSNTSSRDTDSRPSHDSPNSKDKGDSTGAGEKPFDQWLTRKLRDVFDTVANEPLPADLADLVRKLEEKDRSKS